MEGALPLVRLIEQFARLPGVGRKTAQRFAFAVLAMSEEEARREIELMKAEAPTVDYFGLGEGA